MYGYQTFHEKIMLELINAARSGQARHAYIFEGDEGLSLYSSARLFAAALTCTGENAPCGECVNCRLSHSGTNPDITDVETKKKSIGVDEVRAVSEDAYIKPFNSEKKVYIINNAHIMTPQAQNAFLKTLEEPPSFAVFILITPDEENLLQTVRSRCVTVRFPRVSDETVRRYVEQKYPDCGNIDFVVRYSAGIPENADSIINDEGFDELRKTAFDALARVMSQRKLDAYEAAEFMENNKERADVVLELWISFVRDIILIQQGCDSLLTNSDFMPRLVRAANSFDDKKTVNVQMRLIEAVKMQKRYVNLRALTMRLALGEI